MQQCSENFLFWIQGPRSYLQCNTFETILQNYGTQFGLCYLFFLVTDFVGLWLQSTVEWKYYQGATPPGFGFNSVASKENALHCTELLQIGYRTLNCLRLRNNLTVTFKILVSISMMNSEVS